MRLILGFGGAGAILLIWMWAAGTAAMPTLHCGEAAQCELARDPEALLILMLWNDLEALRELSWPARGQLGDAYGNLVLAGRIVRVTSGTRVHELGRTPLTVEQTPRIAVVQVMDGDWAGEKLLSPEGYVRTAGSGRGGR